MKLQWDLREFTKFADNLTNTAKFEKTAQKAAKALSKELLRQMKELTPVEEGTLIKGWNGNNFAVTKKDGGFEVLIVNKTPYALAVNDGHRVRNRKDGEYYQVKHRVKVTSPHKWQSPASDWYVFGHFFVERGILKLTETNQVEQIIMKELEKWWDSV